MVARHYSIMPHHDLQQIVKALQMLVAPQELIHLLENEQRDVEDMEHLYKKNNDIIHNYEKKYCLSQAYLPF